MKLHNPFTVSDINHSSSLIISLIVLIIVVMLGFGILASHFPVLLLVIPAVLAISRVVYAIIKGD